MECSWQARCWRVNAAQRFCKSPRHCEKSNSKIGHTLKCYDWNYLSRQCLLLNIQQSCVGCFHWAWKRHHWLILSSLLNNDWCDAVLDLGKKLNYIKDKQQKRIKWLWHMLFYGVWCMIVSSMNLTSWSDSQLQFTAWIFHRFQRRNYHSHQVLIRLWWGPNSTHGPRILRTV